MGAMSDKIKGKAKKVEGKLTGDRIRTTQGAAEETKGDIGMKVDNSKARVRARASRAKANLERSVSRARANRRSRTRSRSR